ncbi:MAG: CDP-glycerol glycerophosphotransferase family protein, partial [Acutalibacteraceae bacterium]|nr:CDP-glycerol glycerophosphotransferase family protein [Acutalibacteraceae bacterium]
YIMIPEIFRFTSKFRNSEQKCIFLKHGIIKDSMLFKNMYYKHIVHDLFVTSTKRERDFVEELFGYPSGYVKELGLCRFDKLHNTQDKKEKIVLVMPTWRGWLRFGVAIADEKKHFKNSEYFKTYASLLTNGALKDLLKAYGYKLVFYPHFESQRHIDLFFESESDNIVIATKEEYDVQDLLIRSSVLITDFSSVFFDFAYMDKPMIFYQFDEEQFRQGAYKEGYFSYRNDGFGKVLKEENEIIEELENILKNNCVMDEVFEKRRTEFFDLIDDKNCERNFNAIKSL